MEPGRNSGSKMSYMFFEGIEISEVGCVPDVPTLLLVLTTLLGVILLNFGDTLRCRICLLAFTRAVGDGVSFWAMCLGGLADLSSVVIGVLDVATG